MQQWRCLFTDLPLQPREAKAVAQFFAQPSGLRYLPLANILLTRGRRPEAIEVLSWGVRCNPEYLPARILLAREQVQFGLLASAWTTLQPFLGGKQENFLGGKLALFTALLLDERRMTYQLAERIAQVNQHDYQVKMLLEILLLEGYEAAQGHVQRLLTSQGVQLLPVPAYLTRQLPRSGVVDSAEPKIRRQGAQAFPGKSLVTAAALRRISLAQLAVAIHHEEGRGRQVRA